MTTNSIGLLSTTILLQLTFSVIIPIKFSNQKVLFVDDQFKVTLIIPIFLLLLSINAIENNTSEQEQEGKEQ